MSNEKLIEKIEDLNYKNLFKNKIDEKLLEKNFFLLKKEYCEISKNMELRAELFEMYPELKTYFKNFEKICVYRYKLMNNHKNEGQVFKKISCVRDPKKPNVFIIYRWEESGKIVDFNSNLVNENKTRYNQSKKMFISFKGVSTKKLEDYLDENKYSYKVFFEKNSDIYDDIELYLL